MTVRRKSRIMRLGIGLALFGICGCWEGGHPCTPADGSGVHIVLTFDDGPIGAEIADPESSPDPAVLLSSLRQILDGLARQNARGVFYIEGPGSDAAADTLSGVFLEALTAIHDAGHVLGYHCFKHDYETWGAPIAAPVFGRLAMHADLDRLVRFLDTTLEAGGFSQSDFFLPIFRQPFGGLAVTHVQAMLAARDRGWVYHGYLVDSFDWITNAGTDPALVERLHIADEADHVRFVIDRLRQGIERNRERQVIDVLFHVNQFTAAHLDEFVAALQDEAASFSGRPVVFDVPDCYLQVPNGIVDRTFIEDFLLPS
jgi:peptidoglycan/xylan/chitin deacetylase (PgdA/CDA1 family)